MQSLRRVILLLHDAYRRFTEDKGVRDMLSYLKTYKNKVMSLHIHFTTSQKEKPLKHSKEKLPVMETNSTIVVTPLWQVVNLI